MPAGRIRGLGRLVIVTPGLLRCTRGFMPSLAFASYDSIDSTDSLDSIDSLDSLDSLDSIDSTDSLDCSLGVRSFDHGQTVSAFVVFHFVHDVVDKEDASAGCFE